jgi:hypothetical protein
LKYIWKKKKTSNSQSNSEQNVQTWRHRNAWLPAMLLSHNSTNSMALAQKQSWRPMDQNRRSRHKSMHLQPTDLQQRIPKHCLQQMLLGKLDIHM